MSKNWDDVMNGVSLTPDEIRELYNGSMGKIRGARAATRFAQEQIRILQSICDHPRKGEYRCPDCGADWSPD
jgi:hypothetical protein